jgi:ubiquinol-cytochrome c reductase cytochrome c1 subunit
MNSSPMNSFVFKTLAVAVVAATLGASSAIASGDVGGPSIERQHWTFGGVRGHFDRAQLQRGFKVFQEVCSSCHGLTRLSFRNLAEKGGPEFPEDGVKALIAKEYKIMDAPNDAGKVLKRPARLSDAFPSVYSNEQEARATHNGALPPDLSVIAKARGIQVERPFYMIPVAMVKDIFLTGGYQEAGPDYIYALLTGYQAAPKDMKMSDGMNYNVAFAGNQIGMVAPLSDGLVKYTDGSPATTAQYAQDVSAFLAWAADPKLEERKRMGLAVMLYLLVTSVLLLLAKNRLWSSIKH